METKLTLLQVLSPEKNKVCIDDKIFYMFEMSIKRQDLFIEKLQELINSVTSKFGEQDINMLTDFVSIYKKLPKSELVKLFNFICMPAKCGGCNGHKSWSRCQTCEIMRDNSINEEWFEENITFRIIKEIFLASLKQSQMDGVADFFFKKIKQVVEIVMLQTITK